MSGTQLTHRQVSRTESVRERRKPRRQSCIINLHTEVLQRFETLEQAMQMQMREYRATSETDKTTADTEAGADRATSKTGETHATSKIDESDDAETKVFRKVGAVTEAGATISTATADTTSEVAGG